MAKSSLKIDSRAKVDTPEQPPLIWLYSKNKPSGQLFNKDQVDLAQMAKDGWVDTPASLPEEVVLKAKIEANPILDAQGLDISIDKAKTVVKQHGFIVLTPIELEAKIGAALSEAMEGAVKEPEKKDLRAEFAESPKSLTKREHIELAASLGVKLTMSYGETKMIEKIREAMEAEIKPIIEDTE